MNISHMRSVVENRRQRITQQLNHLKSQLIKKDRTYYADENLYRRQSKRTRELISALEGELLMLDCPGEYNELPVAVVADELGLTYDQVRSLIRLGEIEAIGKAAHERITRWELERIAALKTSELLRLGRQESAEIFERAIPHLQNGDLEKARRAYKRLEARQSWRGPYAPAFLVGLELANGELDGVLSSIKLIYELEDPLRKLAVMTCLGRLLRGMRLNEKGAQELRDQLIMLTDGVSVRCEPFGKRRPKQAQGKILDKLQKQAMYLTLILMNELRKLRVEQMNFISATPGQTLKGEFQMIIQNTIYTALYSEFFYEDSATCRVYVDMMKNMISENYQPAALSGNFFE